MRNRGVLFSSYGLMGMYLLLLLASCRTEVAESDGQHRYFFKRYGEGAREQGFMFANACVGGRIISAGYETNDSSNTYISAEFDEYGMFLKRRAPFTDECLPMGSRFSDGSFVIGNRVLNWMAKYDAEGNLLQEWDYGSYRYHIHGEPCLSNGELGQAITNGPSAGASTNYIYLFDDYLQITKSFEVTEQQVGGHIMQLELDRIENNLLYVSGSLIRIPWTFSKPQTAFVAVLDRYDPGFASVKHLPPADSFHSDQMIDRVILHDEGTVQLLTSSNWMFIGKEDEGGSYFELVNWRKDQTLRWRQIVSLGYEIVCPYSISANHLGEMMVVGYVKTGRKDPYLPFAVRLNADGTVKWKKVFHEIFDGTFTDVHMTPEGDLLFSGIQDNFGQKSEGGDGFILKTNADGWY